MKAKKFDFKQKNLRGNKLEILDQTFAFKA